MFSPKESGKRSTEERTETEERKETEEMEIHPEFFLTPPQDQEREKTGIPSTPEFFLKKQKLKRVDLILDTVYDIPAITPVPICLVSIILHMHGEIPVVICKVNKIVTDANYIVKTVPNENLLSTRLMAPAGREHIEYHEGGDECPHYNSSLRVITLSRKRMFLNVRCLPGLMIHETKKERFLPSDYFTDATRTEYSAKGLDDLAADPEFAEYINNPFYCMYYSRKNQYVEKVCISKDNSTADEHSFGFYIDVAIIRPKNETSSTVTVETFILSNKSTEFSEASYHYIEKLLGSEDSDIKQRLQYFIQNGVCNLSTVIEAVSYYTKNMKIKNGNTELFLTDLSCSVHRTFVDSPRERLQIEPPNLDAIEVDELNKEIVDKLYKEYRIPPDYPDHFMNEDGDGYDNGCGVLYLSKIQSIRLSKPELEKREYDKIFDFLRAKLPGLRTRVAVGGSLHFNKRRYRTKRRIKRLSRTKRRPRTRRSKRRTRRSKRRGIRK